MADGNLCSNCFLSRRCFGISDFLAVWFIRLAIKLNPVLLHLISLVLSKDVFIFSLSTVAGFDFPGKGDFIGFVERSQCIESWSDPS